jgi:DNA-binding XRE family transcriptional regulator
MRKKPILPRILKINWVKDYQISAVFNNGESRVVDLAGYFDKADEDSPAYILLDPEEFAKVEVGGHTLSWPNTSNEILGVNGKKMNAPFDICPDRIYAMSRPDITVYQQNIGNLVKEYRTREGITQQELANRCGTTRNYISRIENNRSDIELGTLRKIIEIGMGKKMNIQIL